MIEQVIKQIQQTLEEHGVDYKKIIDDFGQVAAYESRRSGKTFGFSEHIRGLIYAQLSNQRPWGPVAEHLSEIDGIFSNYDADVLKSEDPGQLATRIMEIKCGNRKISGQMAGLRNNIELFEELVSEYGSVDSFIESEDPGIIAKELGSGKRYKLKEVGFTLAMEYLRNVGINAIKPDLHICRMIGPERLGFIDKVPSPEEAYSCLMELEKQTSDSAVYIDNLLWLFAAKDYGNICSANPRCSECSVELCAMNPSSS